MKTLYCFLEVQWWNSWWGEMVSAKMGLACRVMEIR
jgi:hypothetical protein